MKYSVDSIENGFARCEYDDGEMKNIKLSLLPDGVKEGDILEETDGKFIICADETEDEKEEIFNLQQSVFGKKDK